MQDRREAVPFGVEDLFLLLAHGHSEWADYYGHLGAAFDIRIDTSGPDFGWKHFVERIGSGEHIGFGGEELRLPWNPRTV
ncbi:hypothetical protein [Spongiactinospora sp. TRM90649]|uniref:hypothetical protein n=1 Tax=Spongiactinospora sp. TRM90649 TaxID=3031114 RepID=UPI0023F701F9|nr:hypothetical protein [Spongiactinospora sp. TRM90649]MDF5751933.1 hypothetical protein [Spongiactinospora sp. TRM90649]